LVGSCPVEAFQGGWDRSRDLDLTPLLQEKQRHLVRNWLGTTPLQWKKRAGGGEHEKGRGELEGSGDGQERSATKVGPSPVPAGPSLGWYWLVGLQAGHVDCTEKSLPNALPPSFPLADVHYGEGGGHPVQPARVQRHRLHLRTRGTDVSAGPSWGERGGFPRRFAATPCPAYGDTLWALVSGHTGLAGVG